MSMELHVCWRGEFAPSRDALQESLKALGFDATVLHEFAGGEGYWPIDIGAFKTGVEAYPEDNLGELQDNYPVLAEALEGRDKGVTFSFGGDAAECGTALALAAAVAQMADAVIYEPSDGVIYSSSQAADEARQMFQVAKDEGYRSRDGQEHK